MAKSASAPKSDSPAPVAAAAAAAPKVSKAAASAAPAAAAAAPKVSKAKDAKVAAPVVAAAPEVSAEASVADVAASAASTFTDAFAKLHNLSSTIASLRTELRTLERQFNREIRTANKANKRRKSSGQRAPSGFRKPTSISNELAEFLGKPVGTVLSRTDVTREVNAYIREHKLQDAENGRKINPDTKLKNLLKVKKGEELTYFNLQRYMSPHFAKSVKEPVAASA